jgi:hypothetical protein
LLNNSGKSKKLILGGDSENVARCQQAQRLRGEFRHLHGEREAASEEHAIKARNNDSGTRLPLFYAAKFD